MRVLLKLGGVFAVLALCGAALCVDPRHLSNEPAAQFSGTVPAGHSELKADLGQSISPELFPAFAESAVGTSGTSSCSEGFTEYSFHGIRTSIPFHLRQRPPPA